MDSGIEFLYKKNKCLPVLLVLTFPPSICSVFKLPEIYICSKQNVKITPGSPAPGCAQESVPLCGKGEGTFVVVRKGPDQLTLNEPKGRLSWVHLTSSGKAF